MQVVRVGGIEFQEIAEEVLLHKEPPPYEYAEAYFKEFQARSQTSNGRLLYQKRREWVDALAPRGDVLDYGCGYGCNVLRQPNWYGWDINPHCQDRLEIAGKLATDPARFPVVCLFDVLEHLPDPASFLTALSPRTTLFLVIPCWNDWSRLKDLPRWKHWKPNEHLLYGSRPGIRRWIEGLGFQLIESGIREQGLGRVDSYSFVFRRLDAGVRAT